MNENIIKTEETLERKEYVDLSILKTMFTDWQSISTGAQKYVAVAVEKGLISGYEDNTFRGQSGITRAETATLLWRAYQYGNGNKDFEQTGNNMQKEELTPPVNPSKEVEKTPVISKDEEKKPEPKPERKIKRD